MKKIILFDQDLQHYRESLYQLFREEFKKHGYELKIYYDHQLNKKNYSEDMFNGVSFTFSSFRRIVLQENPDIIIQFVWLRYKFLIFFMLWAKVNKIKLIVWSHGINLQAKNQPVKNWLYYLRQNLADALLLYSKNELKYIKANNNKVFVANNTINFNALPDIEMSKIDLRNKYNFNLKRILLCVARFNVNNRKIKYLIELANLLGNDCLIVVVGPGISIEDQTAMKNIPNLLCLGPVYDDQKINELYKLSDIFVMPGAIGLAINQAFFHSLPVVVENVEHGPEECYLKPGINGFLFEEGNITDLYEKVKCFDDESILKRFSENARKTIIEEGQPINMFEGFIKAVKFVDK